MNSLFDFYKVTYSKPCGYVTELTFLWQMVVVNLNFIILSEHKFNLSCMHVLHLANSM